MVYNPLYIWAIRTRLCANKSNCKEQSVLRLKSCGLLKGTEVNSLGTVDNATVNVGK